MIINKAKEGELAEGLNMSKNIIITNLQYIDDIIFAGHA